jgi:DNA repair protein RadC
MAATEIVVKALAPADRPREKLLRLGPGALGDNELAAAVLGHGYRAVHALELATQMLAALGGVQGLSRTTPRDLSRFRGIGPSGAARLLAGMELGRRALAQAGPPRARLASPREVAAYLLPRFGAADVEQFGVLLLDARHRVLHAKVLTRGTVDASPAYPRDVFREAAVAGAAAVVLFHNHPSGDATPSLEDIALTRRLRLAGELMGIDVIDHIILGDATYCSLREAGHVPHA